MKRYQSILMSFTVVALMANPVLAQRRATPGFEKLKTLVGDWQGTGPHGATDASYRLVCGGAALMETLVPTGEPSMVTMYHLNGDKLMLTHYCSIGNQPRMQAKAPAGEIKKIDFAFVDATNLAKPSAGHMTTLALIFEDQDHLQQVWTWRENGKDESAKFSFTRKK